MNRTPLIVTAAENIRPDHPTMVALTETLARQITQAVKSDDTLRDGFRLTWAVEPLNGIIISPQP